MPRIAIFEPKCSGHRAAYVAWMAAGAAEAGHQVVIVTSHECSSCDKFREAVERYPGRVTVAALSAERLKTGPARRFELFTRELRYWLFFRRSFRKVTADFDVDLVFVPYLDFCLHAIAFLGSPFGAFPWAGITMRQRFHFVTTGVNAPRVRMRRLRRWLFSRLLRTPGLRALFTIDRTLVQHAIESPGMARDKIRLLKDPGNFVRVPDRAAARRDIGASDSAVIVLVYGSISARKGVDVLLEAVRELQSQEIVVVLAGVIDSTIKEEVNRQVYCQMERDKKLIIMDGFVSDDVQNSLLSCSDIVWLGYRNFYMMSGVLVLAGQAGLPVLATSNGVVGLEVSEDALGLCIDVSDVRSVADGLEQLCKDQDLRRRLGENGRNRFAGHTIDGFVEALLDIV